MRHAITRLALLGALTALGVAAAARGEETWATRLGYPPDARVLLIQAGDMGAAYEFNRPVQRLLAEGRVQSAGVVVPGPWFAEFARWCRSHPDHDVGISLALVSPGELARWRPVSPRSQVASLVDADGFFWQSTVQVALNADVDEVRTELERQIESARAQGIRPTHLSPQLGALLTRADLTRVYLETARKYWIPAVMVEMTPATVDRLRRDGFPLTAEVVEIINRHPLPKADDLQFVPDSDTYDAKRAALLDVLRELRPGITCLSMHPAEHTPALELLTPRWQNRVWEARLLEDPEVLAFLAAEGFVRTSWRDLMRRFEQQVGESVGEVRPESDPSAGPSDDPPSTETQGN